MSCEAFRQPLADAQAERRSELDSKRVAAVQRFMSDYTSGRNLTFHVEVHDVADPSVHSGPYAGTSRMAPVRGVQDELWNNYQGVLPLNMGTQGGGAATGPGGGGNVGSR